jgi:PAS domain S-box-containing protein
MEDNKKRKDQLITELEALRRENRKREALQKTYLRVESELRQSREKYRNLIEVAVDAVLFLDEGANILSWNKAAESMFGYGQDVLGRPLSILFPKQRWERDIRKEIRRLVDGDPNHFCGNLESKGAHRKGWEFPVEVTLYVWSSRQSRSLAAVIRDISERKQVERLREDVQRTIRHDLRSPLIGITGFARQLLKAGNLTEKQTEWASLVGELSEGMLSKINRSQDLFAMERGEYRLKPKQVELLGLMRNLSLELSPIAEDRKVTLAFFLNGSPVEQLGSPKEAFGMRGEKLLLEDLFGNLLKNAVEASPKNETVRVSISREETRYIIDIHNVGVVPKDIRDSIFEPYVSRGKKGGSGLGAHSALLMANTHGGDITFTTSEKEGTHMVVTLPRSPRMSKKT